MALNPSPQENDIVSGSVNNRAWSCSCRPSIPGSKLEGGRLCIALIALRVREGSTGGKRRRASRGAGGRTRFGEGVSRAGLGDGERQLGRAASSR